MPSGTRQQRVKRGKDEERGRTRALNDARHVQHVIFVDDDAYTVRGIGSELTELAHEAAKNCGGNRLEK